MTTPVVTSVLVGVAVGATHYAGHMVGGEEMAFEDAGVELAGIVVTISATVATYTVLSLAGVTG